MVQQDDKEMPRARQDAFEIRQGASAPKTGAQETKMMSFGVALARSAAYVWVREHRTRRTSPFAARPHAFLDARRRKRWILPVCVFGSASTNLTERGYL